MKRSWTENTEERASARRRKRNREMRTLVLLICLVVMTAVLYLAISIFSWMDSRLQKEEGGSLPVMGEGIDGSDSEGNAAGEENKGGNADGESGGGTEDASQVSSSKVYSQEELDDFVVNAKEEAASDVLDIIRQGLGGGDTIMETLRPLYPEELIVYSGGKYNFVPINRSLKQSSLAEANLNILENGEYQYLQDGQVISHKGIDVSKHQGSIDWNLVAQDGVEFAFIRVGYRGYGTGKMVEDEQYEANIQGALAAGIKVGVYYYSQAITREEVLEEAAFVLEKIKPYQIDCPVVFDVEKVSGEPGRMNDISVEDRTEFTRLFCETIENAGYRPMIYHNTEMGAMMINLEPLEAYDKWFAAYSDKFYYPYEYKVWQYSQSGTVPGIKGAVDLNISFAPLWEE